MAGERWATDLIEPTIDHLLARLEKKEHAGLIRKLIAPVPFRETARMLGVPVEQLTTFLRMAIDLLRIGHDPAAAWSAKLALDEFLRGQIADRAKERSPHKVTDDWAAHTGR